MLERAEDNYIDDLFSSAPAHGATLLCALFPRTYVDVNRAVSDIDMDLMHGHWPGPLRPTRRSHAGIGLIRRLVRPGVPVYGRKLSVPEIQRRLQDYYHPYHDALAALLDEAHYNFGQVWHVNCHAMPSASCPQADFVLGDRDGTSCAPGFTAALHEYLTGRGYRVAVNDPYKGVEILRRHAAPAHGRHSLQVEVNKALYWDEQNNKKSQNYSELKREIDSLVEYCRHYVSNQVMIAALAAD